MTNRGLLGHQNIRKSGCRISGIRISGWAYDRAATVRERTGSFRAVAWVVPTDRGLK
jgi:hypothetical protein